MRVTERGQAVLLVVVAMGLVIIGALGLAIDGSNLYTQRTMAQTAADAAAEAAIMSIFNGTNTGANTFGSAAFNCTTTDVRTPCKYARLNGFGSTTADTVAVDFPNSAPGVRLSGSDPVNLVHVVITRNMQTSFMALLGTSTMPVKAAATAAIIDQLSPIPILVLHPSLASSFSKGGSNTIVICGGSSKSIQVNSTSATSLNVSGNGAVDLSQAGRPPAVAGPPPCNGTGADFGDAGGQTSYPGTLLLGTRPGKFVQPASIVQDPLLSPVVSEPSPAPAPPTTLLFPTPCPGNSGVTCTQVPIGSNNCPLTLPVSAAPCYLYWPGRYDGGITINNNHFSLFAPGLYYMNGGGFHVLSNGAVAMATTSVAIPVTSPDPATGSGMMVFNTGNNAANDIFEFTANSGQIKGVQFGNSLLGSDVSSTYKGILFFQDRRSTQNVSLNHSLQGGGGITLTGTIYLTSTAARTASTGVYQTLSFGGNAGSLTQIVGEIIVDALSMNGGPDIKMTLSPNATLNVRQVALVK